MSSAIAFRFVAHARICSAFIAHGTDVLPGARILDAESTVNIRTMVDLPKLHAIWTSERARMMSRPNADFWGLGVVVFHIVVETVEDPYTYIPPFHDRANSYFLPFIVVLPYSLRTSVPLGGNWSKEFLQSADWLQFVSTHPCTRHD